MTVHVPMWLIWVGGVALAALVFLPGVYRWLVEVVVAIVWVAVAWTVGIVRLPVTVARRYLPGRSH